MATLREKEVNQLVEEFDRLHPFQQKTFIQYLKDEGWSGDRIETLENLVDINTGFNGTV